MSADRVSSSSRLFADWSGAFARLAAAERCHAPHTELVQLSAEVIRTRNILALDRQAAGLPLPGDMVRLIVADEHLLKQPDDTRYERT